MHLRFALLPCHFFSSLSLLYLNILIIMILYILTSYKASEFNPWMYGDECYDFDPSEHRPEYSTARETSNALYLTHDFDSIGFVIFVVEVYDCRGGSNLHFVGNRWNKHANTASRRQCARLPKCTMEKAQRQRVVKQCSQGSGSRSESGC